MLLYTTRLTGKPLIDITTGKKFGNIIQILTDDTVSKVTAILTTTGCYSVEKLFDCNNAVTASGCLACKREGICTLGKEIYNTKGVRIATVKDIVTDGCNVRKILTDQKSLSPSSILIAQDVILLKKRVKKSKQPVAPALPVKKTVNTVCRRSGDFNFLIGRTVDKTISYNNEIIVRRNGKISAEAVRLARQYGKLVELSLHSV